MIRLFRGLDIDALGYVLMNLNSVCAIVVGVTLGMAATVASAVTVVNLDLDFESGPAGTFQVQADGYLAPNVSAFYTDYDATTNTGTQSEVNRSVDGWGVASNNVAGSPGKIEGGRVAGGEALVLQFAQEVTLSSLSLFVQDPGLNGPAVVLQQFALFIDGAPHAPDPFGTGAMAINPPTVMGNGQLVFGTGEFISSFPEDVTGAVFAIIALNQGAGPQGFRLSNFSGSAVVPLPGTAPILGGGLLVGGMILRSRKKKALAAKKAA